MPLCMLSERLFFYPALVTAEPFGYTLLLKSPVNPDSSPTVETLVRSTPFSIFQK